jgi:hypothetical protein
LLLFQFHCAFGLVLKAPQPIEPLAVAPGAPSSEFEPAARELFERCELRHIWFEAHDAEQVLMSGFLLVFLTSLDVLVVWKFAGRAWQRWKQTSSGDSTSTSDSQGYLR